MPLRGFESFCYGAPKICTDFRGGAKKQPVPWPGGTGYNGALVYDVVVVVLICDNYQK